MANIYELVTAKNAKDFIENTTPKKYLGAALFPATKQLGLTLSYLKGRHGAPKVLKAAAFDAKAPVRDRIGVSKVETEMPFFREAMNVKEMERQQINSFLAAGQSQHAEAVVKFVYRDQLELVEGANATAERMRMQVLTTGEINIDSGAEGAIYTYDYGLDSSQFETLLTTAKWDATTSTPIEDIQQWMEAVKLTNGARAICNSATASVLAKHPSIRKAMNPLGHADIFVTSAKAIAWIKEELNVSIAVYDEVFVDEAGVEHKYVEDGVFVLIPASGALGETVYGTTPEESDLMTGATEAEVEIVNTGVAVTTIKIPHPVNVQTIVSEIVMPSFPAADKIFIATVF